MSLGEPCRHVVSELRLALLLCGRLFAPSPSLGSGFGAPHPSNPVSVTGDQRATRTKGQEVFLSDPVPPPSLTIGTGEEALVVRGCCSHVRGPADLPLPGADGIGRAVIGWTESRTVS